MRWSYSSLGVFRQCPHKYFRLRVLKDIPREPETEAMWYGTAFHLAAEEYVRDGKPLPAHFANFEPMLAPLKTLKGQVYCEYEMGLRADFTPCGFGDADVWSSGIADYLCINGAKATVVDYKTGGKSQYADKKQLELMALHVFKHFPEVKTVRAGLLFVVCNVMVKEVYTADKQNEYWQNWLPDVKRIEVCTSSGKWSRKTNFTCKGHCPVLDCYNNGRG